MLVSSNDSNPPFASNNKKSLRIKKLGDFFSSGEKRALRARDSKGSACKLKMAFATVICQHWFGTSGHRASSSGADYCFSQLRPARSSVPALPGQQRQFARQRLLPEGLGATPGRVDCDPLGILKNRT
jgi:hypothetical protein